MLLSVGGLIGLTSGVATLRAVQNQISGLKFGLDVIDPASLIGAALTLGAVALVAAYVPARAASLTDPNGVVRSD